MIGGGPGEGDSVVCLQPVFFSKGHLDARAYTSVVIANAKERYGSMAESILG